MGNILFKDTVGCIFYLGALCETFQGRNVGYILFRGAVCGIFKILVIRQWVNLSLQFISLLSLVLLL